MRLKEIKIH